jgi:hypothetical protein
VAFNTRDVLLRGSQHTLHPEEPTVRFVKRILIGFGAASALAIAAPAAATAATPANASATTYTVYDADWGPYYSDDHKAKASGHVTVDKKKFKKWFWDKKWVTVTKCWKHEGKTFCKKDKKLKKVWTWKWDYKYSFKVDSTLKNHKWWGYGKFRCAWETFKVTKYNGFTYHKSFYNCKKHPADFSFFGKDAKLIEVQVSRGNKHHPKGHFGPWHTIYSAV